MSELNNGDIVLINFPFTDLKTTKLRPALIISKNIVHKTYDDYTLMFISSVVPLRIEPFEYLIKEDHIDFNLSGLKFCSVFKANKIVTLQKELIKRKIGKLGSQIKKDVDHIIKNAIGLS